MHDAAAHSMRISSKGSGKVVTYVRTVTKLSIELSYLQLSIEYLVNTVP